MKEEIKNNTITKIELWFWRIFMLITLMFSLINYWDNRQQDKLIFKTIDKVAENIRQIRSLAEFDANENQINRDNIEIFNEIISRLPK